MEMEILMSHVKKDLVIGIIAVIALYMIIESFGITCPIKYVTGISCAGCGMSRAYLSLIRLDISGAFAYHPLFILPPLVVVVYFLKRRIPAVLYKAFMVFVVAAFLLVYLYRIIFLNDGIVVFEPQNNIVFRVIRYFTRS